MHNLNDKFGNSLDPCRPERSRQPPAAVGGRGGDPFLFGGVVGSNDAAGYRRVAFFLQPPFLLAFPFSLLKRVQYSGADQSLYLNQHGEQTIRRATFNLYSVSQFR